VVAITTCFFLLHVHFLQSKSEVDYFLFYCHNSILICHTLVQSRMFYPAKVGIFTTLYALIQKSTRATNPMILSFSKFAGQTSCYATSGVCLSPAKVAWWSLYIQTINSDNESEICVDTIPYQNKDDDSDNETIYKEPKGNSDDEKEEEQYDFDKWFKEQMDIHQNRSVKTTGKEIILWISWTTSLATIW